MAHQALHIQWCGGELVTQPYKYMGFTIHGSPNVPYPKVCDTWLTTPYKYNRFHCFHCLQVFHVVIFQCFPCFPCFPCSHCFPCFPGFTCFPLTAAPGSVSGARLTVFLEVRFMRCAVHGSNLNTMKVPAQLSKQPSYQRWTRLQPMLESPTKS